MENPVDAITEATARELITTMTDLIREIRQTRVDDQYLENERNESLAFEVDLLYTQLLFESTEAFPTRDCPTQIMINPVGKPVEFWRAFQKKVEQNNWSVSKMDTYWLLRKQKPILNSET
jgi:hypothetical protein